MPQPPRKSKLTLKQFGDSAKKYDSLSTDAAKRAVESSKATQRVSRSTPSGKKLSDKKIAETNAEANLARGFRDKAKKFRADSAKANPPKKRK